MTELSDDLLVAYVDGQLARDQSRAVKRVLDQDIVAAHRAETLRIAHDRLEWVLDSLLEDERALLLGDIEPPPPSPPPRPTLRDRVAQWGTATLASAGVAVALFGLFGGYAIWGGQRVVPEAKQSAAAPAGEAPLPAAVSVAAIQEAIAPAPEAQVAAAPAPALPDARSWQDDVAQAQALLARESLEVSLDSQGNLDFVRFQLAKAIGADVVIPDLTAHGLTFVRAQILRYRGEPLAQIAYLPASGAPVALYAKPDATAPPETATRSVAGLATAAWSSKGVAYLFTGQSADAEFERVASAARQQTLGF